MTGLKVRNNEVGFRQIQVLWEAMLDQVCHVPKGLSHVIY